MKTTFDLLVHIASLLGLGGAADKVDLDEALVQAHSKIEQIVRYHHIKLPSNYGSELRGRFVDLSDDSKIGIIDTLRLIQNSELQLIFGATTQLSRRLPEVLNQLGHIYYLRSVSQQDGSSCGYWSAFNADAVDYLVTNRLNLTSENIENQAIIYWTYIKKDDYLETMEINSILRNIPFAGTKLNQHTVGFLYKNINRAQENKVHLLLKDVAGDDGEDASIGSDIWPACCHINGPHIQKLLKNLTANDKTGDDEDNFNPIEFSIGLKEKRTNFFNNLKAYFLNQYVTPNQPGALHFICNLDGGYHWVLISIVKLHHLRRPILVILDSANFSLTGNFLEYVLFLHQQFIQPYIDASNDQ